MEKKEKEDHRDNQEYRALLGLLHTLRFRRSADDKGHRYQRNGWSEEQQDNQPTDAGYQHHPHKDPRFQLQHHHHSAER